VEGGPLPALRDVAVAFDGNPGVDVWLTQRGGDAQVWELDAVGSYRAAKHPATGFARLAVAPDRTLWAVGGNGTLWRRVPSGQWLQANAVVGVTVTAPLEDVAVSSDGTVWLTGQDGTMWSTTDGSVLVERTVLLQFRRLSGGPGGMIWGITGTGALLRFNGTWWDALEMKRDYLDVSVTFEGQVWVVRDNGVVATTSDGVNFVDLPGESGFESVAAGRYGISWGVKADGSLFIWHPVSVGGKDPPPPPPPPPPPTPPLAPAITVSVEGEGFTSVFVVSGSRFTANSNVSIRATRIEKGTFHDVRFPTRSNTEGEIFERLPIPCLSGLVLNFTATDGRPNPADLTDVLWSNAVATSCL
jgi:hypothetical protein